MKRKILITLFLLSVTASLTACDSLPLMDKSENTTGLAAYEESNFLEAFVDYSSADLQKDYNALKEHVDDTEYKRIGELIQYLGDNNLLGSYSRDYGILAGYILKEYAELTVKNKSTTTLKEFDILWKNDSVFAIDPHAKMYVLSEKIKEINEESAKTGSKPSYDELLAYRVPDEPIRFYMIVQYLLFEKKSGSIGGNYDRLADFATAYMVYSNAAPLITEYGLNISDYASDVITQEYFVEQKQEAETGIEVTTKE